MEMPEDIRALCDQFRQIGFDIHRYHSYGHIEKVYENALLHRLTKVGIQLEPQSPVVVQDEDGTILGELRVDFLAEKKLIVEVKAVRALLPEHTSQLLGYLRASKMEHGLLLNFGAPKFEIRKFALSPNK